MQVTLVPHMLNGTITQTIVNLIYNNPYIIRENITKQLGANTKLIGRYVKKTLEDKVKFIGRGYSGH